MAGDMRSVFEAAVKRAADAPGIGLSRFDHSQAQPASRHISSAGAS